MINIIIGIIIGYGFTLVALLIGYSLGKHQTVVPTDVRKQINSIFRKVVPNNEVGVIPRLTQRELDIALNPKLKQEQDVMGDTFNQLNK